MTAVARKEGLGSAGCQPAVLGSLPSTRFGRAICGMPRRNCRRAAGKLPAAAGWQSVLPMQR